MQSQNVPVMQADVRTDQSTIIALSFEGTWGETTL
jgi:hypothetical protein